MRICSKCGFLPIVYASFTTICPELSIHLHVYEIGKADTMRQTPWFSPIRISMKWVYIFVLLMEQHTPSTEVYRLPCHQWVPEENYHLDEIFSICCTGRCYFSNFWGSRWLNFHQMTYPILRSRHGFTRSSDNSKMSKETFKSGCGWRNCYFVFGHGFDTTKSPNVTTTEA